MLEIKNYLHNDFKAIESYETIEFVQDFFADVSFSHFPIVEESVYIGSISAFDIETFEPKKSLKDYRYVLEGFFARPSMIWLDVLEIFAKNDTNVIPVLDEKNKYVGYYQIEDIIKFFNQTPFLKEPGGVIVIEKASIDFSMSQAVQIVESNNGKVLGLLVSETTIDKTQATLKIALGAMNEIIQTFRRFGYEIISEHQEDSYVANLKERSDYLDKYLNI
jgi:predicted transcriptional regulator